MSINDLKSGLVSVADAIRSKTGSSASLKIEDMPAAIQSIETGSGSGSTSDIQWPPDDPNEEYSWLLIDLSNYDSTEVTFAFSTSDNDTYSIDWGDGSEAITFTRNSDNYNRGFFTHDYQTKGEYLIRLDTQGTLNLGTHFLDHKTTTSSTGPSSLIPENFILKKAIFRESVLTTSITTPLVTHIMLEELDYHSSLSSEPLLLTYSPNLKHVEITGTFATFYKGYNLCNCTSLKTLEINAPITTIPTYFLNNAYSLEKFDCPSTVTNISSYAFYNCTGLEHFVILNDLSVVSLANANAFSNTTCNFYVPDDLVDSYKAATNWITYADRILPLSDCPSSVYSTGSED